MLGTDNHYEHELTFPEVDAEVQAEAQIVADAMCLATVTGLMQSGLPYRAASSMVSKMARHFSNIALDAVCNTLPSPQTYLLVILGDHNCRERMFADCEVRLVTGAGVVGRMQRGLKSQGKPHMSFDASLTLEAAMVFVDSNREGASDASCKKH